MSLVERLTRLYAALSLQSKSYDAEAVHDAIFALEAKDKEIERLREALAFYANPEIYKPHPHGPGFDRRDLSYSARAALHPIQGEGDG